MVLKRLLVTALGALGLGALAAGPALGQDPGEGNIPAPNLFDDQIACTMNLPNMAARATTTVVPDMGMTSPLDDAIGMGDVALDTNNANIGTVLNDIGYVIPAGGNNCGAGSTATAPVVDGESVGFFAGAQDESIPKDVAEGYSTLLTKFMEVYGDPGMAESTGLAGILAMARTALSMAGADATATELEALQTAVDDALEDYNKAKAEFDAIAGGPIYTAGVAEWMAKSDVTNAVDAYNTAVGMAATTKTALDALNYATAPVGGDGAVATPTSKYVPLGAPNALVGGAVTISDGMVTIGAVAALRTYANADGDNYATVDSMTGVTTISTSNFDRNGNLVVPMADTDTGTDGVQLGPVVSAAITSVADIRTVVENTNLAAAELKKARDAIGPTQLAYTLYDQVYQRAQAEADYYNGVWADLLADTTDHRTENQRDEEHADYEKDPITIAGRNAAYVRASNTRESAEADLRAKAAARESATEAVVDAFQSPASFYDQLVARRQAKKFAADQKVAEAENPSTTLTKAAEDAATALTKAEKAQSDFQDLFSKASDPVQDLVTEMLKEGGDDGQALVDAISGSYDVANTAKTTADQVAEEVAGLTGDEGAVSMNTQAIADNEKAISGNTMSIDGIEAEIWGDASTDGMSRIDANETRSMENATSIATNTANIATNTENITGLRTDVDQNIADIETNTGRITTNEGAISSNADAIAANMNSIGQNQAAIGRNSQMITGLQDQMEIVRAGVAASMALAGMPAINGRGISIGVGSFDGESAFAVGFQIQSDMASFKVGVTSAGGETGASAGVGFQF